MAQSSGSGKDESTGACTQLMCAVTITMMMALTSVQKGLSRPCDLWTHLWKEMYKERPWQNVSLLLRYGQKKYATSSRIFLLRTTKQEGKVLPRPRTVCYRPYGCNYATS